MHRLVNKRAVGIAACHIGIGFGKYITSYAVLHRQKSSSAIKNNKPHPCLVLSKLNGSRTAETTQEYFSQLNNTEKRLLINLLNSELLKKEEWQSQLNLQAGPLTTPSQLPEETVTENYSNAMGFFEVSPQKMLHQKLDDANEIPPSKQALLAVGLQNALPFIGFGFIDNLIMILAADYIDLTLGAALGISTMASAALGNTISDVAGIGSAWYVQKAAHKFGIRQPMLTKFQLQSWQMKCTTNLGRAIGVTIGCLLGMFPLLFLDIDTVKKSDKLLAEEQTTAIIDKKISI